MRTILPRKVLLGLAMVLGGPALAQAQLFPNLPIRRERPDCSHENPQYRMVRQEYWGYYPTCWRKFPPGWGCPAPEPPDWEASKRQYPYRAPDDAAANKPPDLGNGTDPQGDAPQPRTDPGTLPPVPPLPEGDAPSPFENTPRPPAGRPATDRPPTDPGDPNPPVDAPRPPGVSTPLPLGDLPGTARAQPPSRRRTVVAGLFGGRRR